MDDLEYLDVCAGKWASLAASRRTRQQQTVVDVVNTIGAVEGDGLHGFWNDYGSQMDRIIESFRLAGIDDVARMLTESSFCRDVIGQGLDGEEHWKFSADQEAALDRLESQIFAKAPDAREALLRFLPKRRGYRPEPPALTVGQGNPCGSANLSAPKTPIRAADAKEVRDGDSRVRNVPLPGSKPFATTV